MREAAPAATLVRYSAQGRLVMRERSDLVITVLAAAALGAAILLTPWSTRAQGDANRGMLAGASAAADCTGDCAAPRQTASTLDVHSSPRETR
jgi:hypothetical protein